MKVEFLVFFGYSLLLQFFIAAQDVSHDISILAISYKIYCTAIANPVIAL